MPILQKRQRLEEELPMMLQHHSVCIICRTKPLADPMQKYSPWPVARLGKCCKKCHDEVVVPQRLELLMRDPKALFGK